jgi:hypothetical protein
MEHRDLPRIFDSPSVALDRLSRLSTMSDSKLVAFFGRRAWQLLSLAALCAAASFALLAATVTLVDVAFHRLGDGHILLKGAAVVVALAIAIYGMSITMLGFGAPWFRTARGYFRLRAVLRDGQRAKVEAMLQSAGPYFLYLRNFLGERWSADRSGNSVGAGGVRAWRHTGLIIKWIVSHCCDRTPGVEVTNFPEVSTNAYSLLSYPTFTSNEWTSTIRRLTTHAKAVIFHYDHDGPGLTVEFGILKETRARVVFIVAMRLLATGSLTPRILQQHNSPVLTYEDDILSIGLDGTPNALPCKLRRPGMTEFEPGTLDAALLRCLLGLEEANRGVP